MYGNNFRSEHLLRNSCESATQSNVKIAAFSKGLGDVVVLSREVGFGSGRKRFVTDGEVPVSADGLHISVHGAWSMGETFLQSPRGRAFLVCLWRRGARRKVSCRI